MKSFFLTIAFLFFTGALCAQQVSPKEAFLEKWENSKEYLIAIAEAMPEGDYDFQPTERQMTFKEQLLHIKGNMDWLGSTYFSLQGMEDNKEKQAVDKEEIMVLIREAFESLSDKVIVTSEENLLETVDFFAGPKSKLQILNLLQDHVTHHRGQLIVYLNLRGIEPPKYVGW